MGDSTHGLGSQVVKTTLERSKSGPGQGRPRPFACSLLTGQKLPVEATFRWVPAVKPRLPAPDDVRVGTVRDDASVDELNDAVAALRETRVVGDDQERRPTDFVDIAHQVEHDVGVLGVEVAARLVCEHKRGIHRQRTGDGDALLLATGNVGGLVVSPRRKGYPVEQRGSNLTHLRIDVAASGKHGHHHILERRERRQQVVILENESDRTAAQPCNFASRSAHQRLARR